MRNVRIISTCSVAGTDITVGNSDEDHIRRIISIVGTQKISYTLNEKHKSFQADDRTDLPRDLFRQYTQAILWKRKIDPFVEPRLDRLLAEFRANEFVLIGATAEGAVVATALGLLARRNNVTVVIDAVGTHDKAAAEYALRMTEAKGAKLIRASEVLGNSSLRQVMACDCDRCRKRLHASIRLNTE